MKLRLFIWLGLEFVLAFILGTGSGGTRRDHMLAVRIYMDNPNSQTETELERQRQLTKWHKVGFSSFLFGGMALVTIPVIVSVSRTKPSN